MAIWLPAPYTLVVLAAVLIVRELLFRHVGSVGDSIGSLAVKSDAWHHTATRSPLPLHSSASRSRRDHFFHTVEGFAGFTYLLPRRLWRKRE